MAITDLVPGSVFGDVLAGCAVKSPVTILARTACRAMFIPCQKLLCPLRRPSPGAHAFNAEPGAHHLGKILCVEPPGGPADLKKPAGQALRLFVGAGRRRRGRHLLGAPVRAGLAEYLNCERSALCRELSRMRAEGLLETYKNSFKLLDKTALQRQYER